MQVDDEGSAGPGPAPAPAEAPKQMIVFDFTDEDSTLFRMSRAGVSVFQLAIVGEVIRAMVDREMNKWAEQSIQNTSEDEAPKN